MIDLKKNVKKYGKTKSENIMTNIINSYEVLQKNAKSVVLNEDLRKLVESPVQTGGNDPLVKIGGNESEQLFVGLHLDAIKEFSEKLVNDINNNPENEESVSTSADVDPINDDELENSEKQTKIKSIPKLLFIFQQVKIKKIFKNFPKKNN